jgi:hypothetical protein
MPSRAASSVSPTGVLTGDPDTLAGLSERRGAAVLAYCEIVAPAGRAVAAAADAFARFRAEVIASENLDGIHPDALLLTVTRRAAADHAPMLPGSPVRRLARGRATPAACALVPELLVARAERRLSAADDARLDAHLDRCPACREARDRFQRAERAYFDPPAGAPPPLAVRAMVKAMSEVSLVQAHVTNGVASLNGIPAAPVAPHEAADIGSGAGVGDVPAAVVEDAKAGLRPSPGGEGGAAPAPAGAGAAGAAAEPGGSELHAEPAAQDEAEPKDHQAEPVDAPTTRDEQPEAQAPATDEATSVAPPMSSRGATRLHPIRHAPSLSPTVDPDVSSPTPIPVADAGSPDPSPGHGDVAAAAGAAVTLSEAGASLADATSTSTSTPDDPAGASPHPSAPATSENVLPAVPHPPTTADPPSPAVEVADDAVPDPLTGGWDAEEYLTSDLEVADAENGQASRWSRDGRRARIAERAARRRRREREAAVGVAASPLRGGRTALTRGSPLPRPERGASRAGVIVNPPMAAYGGRHKTRSALWRLLLPSAVVVIAAAVVLSLSGALSSSHTPGKALGPAITPVVPPANAGTSSITASTHHGASHHATTAPRRTPAKKTHASAHHTTATHHSTSTAAGSSASTSSST